VLAAVKENYPNMVGQIISKIGRAPMLMGAYGAFPDIWMEKDGQLVYGGIQPEVKTALEKLAEWYRAGYIDPEFVIVDAEAKWVAGDVFSRSAMWWQSWVNNVPLTQNVPECVLSSLPYLKGPSGLQGKAMGSGVSTSAYAIASSCANPVALFVHRNHYTDSAYRNMEDLRSKYEFRYASEPNQVPINQDEFLAMLDEGVDLDKARAARRFDYAMQGPDQGDSEGFFNEYVDHGLRHGIKTYQRATDLRDALVEGLTLMKNGGDKETLGDYPKALYEQVLDAWGMMLCMAHLDGALVAQSFRDTEVRERFVGAPTEAMVEHKAYLDKLQDETYVKIIMGEAPASAFDQFVDDWMGNGGDQIVKEVNDWYLNSK
jgi:putative aldouronate transport system substrate-binding protein